MTEKNNSVVYERNVLELVTVAVEYCTYVENAQQKERKEFVGTMLKLLPLLYLKGALCPKYDSLNEYTEPFAFVSMENYDIVRGNIAYVMGEADDYLDVFVEDMKYSDTPILTTVSENLADIYQDIKNFVCAFRDSTEEVRMYALVECKSNFEHYWGQKLLNVMRALHESMYGMMADDDEDDNEQNEY